MRRCLPALVLAVSFAGPAAAIDLPTRKPGLWEIKMVLENSQVAPPAMQHCIDAATDKLLHEKFSVGQESCSKHDISRSGSTFVIDSSCKFGNMATTTHAVFEGDFDSAYTVNVSTTLDGGVKKNMTMQAKWLGPCKPDQKPGDIEMPGGMKMNILDMPKTPGAPLR
ncbi:MAG TPA: DUF3617 family protein [Reyranella sp.]|nr:DUF3617 family protein [Reyranella sp.]